MMRELSRGAGVFADNSRYWENVEPADARIRTPCLTDFREARHTWIVHDDRDDKRIEPAVHVAGREHHALVFREWWQSQLCAQRPCRDDGSGALRNTIQ